MKPIKIKITAFGPYRDTEVIDFRELKGHTLFVVSGNTGAGKTTIFDAISFALYGEASGEDRQDHKLMRSHFAEDGKHTSVELLFELRDRIYRIFRQLPHVKEGNKAPTGQKYEFFEVIDGKEVPCVDRQMVTEVNHKVEELLGLTKDQFSQIVMLPQGEFRKLLTSETENKEEILRRIFKTEPYKWISERLNTKRRTIQAQFELERQTRDTYITNIRASLPDRGDSTIFSVLNQDHHNVNQVINGLEEEANFYKQEFEKYQSEHKQQAAIYEQKLGEFHTAKVTNETFKDLEHKRTLENQLTNDIPKINEQKTILEKAQKASHLIAYEQQVIDWRKEEITKQTVVERAKVNALNAKKQYQNAKEYYDRERNKEERRDQVKRDIDRLEHFYPIVKNIDDKQKEMALTKKTFIQLEQDLNVLDDKLVNDKKLKVQLGQDIKGLEETLLSITKKRELLQELREVTRTLQDYLKLSKEKKEIEHALQSKEAIWKKSKNNYQLIENQWIEGQAGLIALELHKGEPCPVCGSLDHPKPALKHDSVPTKEALDYAKQEQEKAETIYRDALTAYQTTSRLLQDKYHEIEKADLNPRYASDLYHDNIARGKQLKTEVDQLEKNQERLSSLRKDIEKIEKQIEQRQMDKEKIEQFYQKKKTSYETQKALYNESLKDIPEDIRTLSALEGRIVEIKKIKEKLESDWKQAQESLTTSQEHHTKMASALENSEQQYKETVEKRKKAELTLSRMCEKAGFETVEAYTEAVKKEDEQQAIKASIEEFYTKFETVKQQIKDLEEQLKNKEVLDLNVLQTELNQLKSHRDSIEDRWRKSKDYLKVSQRLKEDIISSHQKVENIEKQLEMVTELYDIVRGQNSKKVSFERYLQIEFLEQIVQAANARLRRLSNGQFQLIRSERQESRGKQSGLGLDVYDAYTGQTRDVKTLSGGEKFNASLCLALGMADVIQSFQGGVSIDTMFIDEGFGSLDEESLTKAIDTLIELQKSGRMIGVISHVQEMKQTIPAILEVHKTREGYSKTRFILK